MMKDLFMSFIYNIFLRYLGITIIWDENNVCHAEKRTKHSSILLLRLGLKDDVLPETLSSLKIVLPETKSSLTLDPLKQMVIITP
jgi:hypothetical protein